MLSIEQIIEKIENEIQVDLYGKGKASIRATARLCGVDESTLREHFEGAGKNPSRLAKTLMEYGFNPAGFFEHGVPDIAVGLCISYYASKAGNRCTQIAKLCNDAMLAYGVRRWMQQIKGWTEPERSVDDQLFHYSERKSIRESLKDVYRIETMDTVARWVKKNGGNAPKTCAEFHDRMNERIYGAIARHIRDENDIPDGELIRDYFPSHKMMLYTTVYQAAKNLMIDEGMAPLDAVDRACEIVLGRDYVPSRWGMEEPIKKQGKRLKSSNRRKFGMQLQLEFFY